MDKETIEIKLSKKSIKDTILALGIIILIGVVIYLLQINTFIIITYNVFAIFLTIYILLNIKKCIDTPIYILNEEGFHVNKGQNKFAKIEWSNISKDELILVNFNNRVYLQLNLINKDIYLQQLDDLNYNASKYLERIWGLKETSFPIEGYNIDKNEILELIVKFSNKYSEK